jgi:chaperonin GroEL (HSP60 family)
MHAYFAAGSDAQVVEMKKPAILVHEKKIASVREFLPLLGKVAQAGKRLLVIAKESKAKPSPPWWSTNRLSRTWIGLWRSPPSSRPCV